MPENTMKSNHIIEAHITDDERSFLVRMPLEEMVIEYLNLKEFQWSNETNTSLDLLDFEVVDETFHSLLDFEVVDERVAL